MSHVKRLQIPRIATKNFGSLPRVSLIGIGCDKRGNESVILYKQTQAS